MHEIKVHTGNSYRVIIGSGIIKNTADHINELMNNKKSSLCIISDDKVFPIYGKALEKTLCDAGFDIKHFVFKNGENSKNINTYIDILTFLSENKFTRSDILIALGGGVVGDITGFCAATYLRGIKYISIPTTLLSAVDSSVGGKTGIDLDCGKNLVGAFCQPSAVICDTDTFKTLDEREISCGYAEIIKYGVLCDKELFSSLEEGNADIEKTVAKCVEIKRCIVEDDERESKNGSRIMLNLGHTLGHAVELHSGYSLSHGACVAIGMMKIAEISEKYGFLEENSFLPRLEKILSQYGLPTDYKASASEIYDICLHDKKSDGKSITLIVPQGVGKCIKKEIPLEDFSEMLEFSFPEEKHYGV